MLNDLVRKIQQTQLPDKDAEAESFLRQNLGGNPDSLYILAQTVVVQNLALDRAKAQVQQLQQQLEDAHAHAIQSAAPPQHTSFLGSLLGRRDPAPPPPPPPNYAPRAAAAPPPDYYPPAPAYAPQYSAAPPPPPSGGSSFLRSAATTAAGVAAGALAFEGVESLLHGFGHEGGGFGGPSFGGGGFGDGGFGQRPEETIINNYYDDPNQSGGMQEHHEHEASFDERPDSFGGDQGSDRGAQLQDAGYDPGGTFTEPQGIDTLDDDQTTGGLDDSSSFDDSGSFDDGGGDDSGII